MSRRTGRRSLVENLMTALAKARDEDKEEFEYDGKTYKVSDFDENDSEKDDDNSVEENIETAEDKADDKVDTSSVKKSKRGAAAGSTAKDNIKAESVWADVSSRGFHGDIASIFEGGDFSVEFLDRAHAVFESAVSERTREIATRLEEEANLKLEEAVKTQVDEAVSQIDDYLSYVADEWKQENKIAIERGIKADICESFMTGLKDLFEAHYIDMPEAKYDVLEEAVKNVDDLKAQLSEQITKNGKLAKQNKLAENNLQKAANEFKQLFNQTNTSFEKSLNEAQGRYEQAIEASKSLTACEAYFGQISKDLTATQTEKLRGIAEGIDFDSPDDFYNKLEMIKESTFGGKSRRNGSAILDEDHQVVGLNEENSPSVTVRTAEYAKYMSRKSQ